MTELLYWILTSGLLFLFFVIALIIGLNRRKEILRASVFIFILFLGCAAVTGYKFITISYNKVKTFNIVDNAFKPRSSKEIYQSLFGKSPYTCLQVANYQDHTVPFMDCCIWLELNTCPHEIQRLLQQRAYEMTKSDKLLLDLQNPDFGEKPKWWTPQVIGDTALVFQYNHIDKDRKQAFFVSPDSTKAYYYDMVY